MKFARVPDPATCTVHVFAKKKKIVLYLNSGNSNPPADMKLWLKCQGSGKTLDPSLAQFPRDIYAFGTQVCNT